MNFGQITEIGAGNFGTVYKAYTGREWVAVKALNTTGPVEEELTAEAETMKRIPPSDFVVRFIAKSTFQNRPCIVLEFLEHGSVLNWVRKLKHEELNYKTLLEVGLDMVRGLVHLHGNSPPIIHGDLACRNVLIRRFEGQRPRVAIADFGLSETLYNGTHVTKAQKAVPIMWEAPEVLQRHHLSIEGDMYSMGIVLWELFNRGKEPEPMWFVRGKTKDFLKRILDGEERLPLTWGMTDALYESLKQCWDLDRKKRPTAPELLETWTHLLETEDFDYPQVNLNPEDLVEDKVSGRYVGYQTLCTAIEDATGYSPYSLFENQVDGPLYSSMSLKELNAKYGIPMAVAVKFKKHLAGQAKK